MLAYYFSKSQEKVIMASDLALISRQDVYRIAHDLNLAEVSATKFFDACDYQRELRKEKILRALPDS